MKLLALKALTAAAALTSAPQQAKAIVVFDPAAVAEAISNGLVTVSYTHLTLPTIYSV